MTLAVATGSRTDQVQLLRTAAVESLRITPNEQGRRAGDPLMLLLPGDGLERTTIEQQRLVVEAIGRPIKLPASMGHANVALLRATLRRWAAHQ